MMANSNLIARGPLLPVHRHGGATIATVNGWEIATRYPAEPPQDGNALIDLSHWATYEINGPQTGTLLTTACGADVPLRTIHVRDALQTYRLSDRRAILFDTSSGIPHSAFRIPQSLDVTGGWATLALIGPGSEHILSKITAVDLRRETLPPGRCCQGPLFGVNTLFGRFENRFDLHICTDSTEFFWEVLMDAGAEFGLKPAGSEFYSVAQAPRL